MPAALDPDIVEKIRIMARDGFSSREIGEALGRSAKSVQKVFRRYNISCLPQHSVPPRLNHFWKGGVIIDKSGYVLIKINGHPFASKSGYVREHRLVMEQSLGRYLLPNEVVHHLDGNKQNNQLENLELFQSNSEHLRIELTGKCPKWSPEGYEKMRQSRRDYWARLREARASPDPSISDGEPCNQ
jgi:hypothetical protein